MKVATPVEATQADELVAKFDLHGQTLVNNSLYYESSFRPQTIGLAVPPEMQNLVAQIGWPRVYLDSLEERLDIEGFRLAGSDSGEGDERLWSWWQYNNLDEDSGMGHIEAFIHGRAFITIAAPGPEDEKDKPIIRVESAACMWADIDYRTHKVRSAVRVFRDPENKQPDRVTLYTPTANVGLVRSTNPTFNGWVEEWRVDHNLGVTTVVPLFNRVRLSEKYGQSEIRPELRSVTDAAARIMMNMQGAAELMALPQRLLFGVTREELLGSGSDALSSYQAYMARILAIPNESGDASAQQFSAAELRNFTEVLDQLAKQAATYTGLPPQYLAFQSDNPASADAIRASETRLVKKAERKQRMFGGAWEEVMRIALRVMKVEVKDVHRLETVWRDPSTPTFAAMADGVVKLASTTTPSGVPVIPIEQARIELRYSLEQRRQMKEWDRESPKQQLANLLEKPATPPQFSDAPEE
jgi:hypothetical protein